MTSCGSDSGGQGRGGGGWQQEREAVSVEVASVSTSSISEQIRAFGSIKAQDVVTVIPQVSNRIVRIDADLGDSVSQGDVLAKIHDVPYRDALEQAQAQLRQSRSAYQRDSTSYERQQQLYERNAASRSELDDARSAYESSRAQYESARAALTQSREDLENTEIRSPVDGVVTNRMVAQGDLARTGEPAFEIANIVGYETRLFLPTQDWEEITVGLPVELRFSNRDGIAAEGVVSRISPQLNEATGLGEVVVSLTDISPRVRQGSLMESRVTLRTNENSVVIPRSATIEQIETYIEPETNTVEIRRNYAAFVAVGDTVAEQRQIEIGLEQGERVEVLSGLEPDEKLIITGQRNISDGDRIRVAGQDRRPGQEQHLEGEPPSETAGSNR